MHIHISYTGWRDAYHFRLNLDKPRLSITSDFQVNDYHFPRWLELSPVVNHGPRWLSRYFEVASAAGCWLITDAQSGFRKNGSRGEPIDAEKLKLLMKEVFEWGVLRKRVEFGICGLDITIPPEELTGLFQVGRKNDFCERRSLFLKMLVSCGTRGFLFVFPISWISCLNMFNDIFCFDLFHQVIDSFLFCWGIFRHANNIKLATRPRKPSLVRGNPAAVTGMWKSVVESWPFRMCLHGHVQWQYDLIT